MKATVVKYFYEQGYSVRQTAIISEVTEDYVRKIMMGKRAASIEAVDGSVTDGMRTRAKTIDYVMSLKGADNVEGQQRYNYISLLSYMGFTLPELTMIFPTDKKSFVSIAAMRSGEAWKRFDATIIGLPQERYNFTFIDKTATYRGADQNADEGNDGYLVEQQNSRRAAKLRNRELARKNLAKN